MRASLDIPRSCIIWYCILQLPGLVIKSLDFHTECSRLADIMGVIPFKAWQPEPGVREQSVFSFSSKASDRWQVVLWKSCDTLKTLAFSRPLVPLQLGHMNVLVSQITSSATVYWKLVRINDNVKVTPCWPLYGGNRTLTSGFPSQRTSNAEGLSCRDIFMPVITPFGGSK